MAHIRSTTGTAVQRTNCHPFRHGDWLFQHNGVIRDFQRVKRDLMLAISPDLFPEISGSTDSEIMFFLALTFGLRDDPVAGVERMVGFVEDVGRKHGGTLKKIKDTGAITLAHREFSVPFSYYDDKQQPVGYDMDLCYRIVDAVKKELRLDKLEVKLTPVTSPMRIPLIANGTVDLECGSTTNTLERQKQVAFTITNFVTANRFVSRKASNVKTVDDLKGKTVVSTAGSTNIKQITKINAQRTLGMNILNAKDHPEAFLMVETGRAAAFVMDDILLYSMVASAKEPAAYEISADPLSVEPYAIMLRRDDAAFKKIVDAAMIAIYKSGEINAIYDKWFMRPIPPKNINLNVPMGAAFKKVVGNPTDSGDPAAY